LNLREEKRRNSGDKDSKSFYYFIKNGVKHMFKFILIIPH
jgi:hypothetical protein